MTKAIGYTRSDFMYPACRMGPAASGSGLYDIDRVIFIVTKSGVKNGKS